MMPSLESELFASAAVKNKPRQPRTKKAPHSKLLFSSLPGIAFGDAVFYLWKKKFRKLAAGINKRL
jgi:hypothetical protein